MPGCEVEATAAERRSRREFPVRAEPISINQCELAALQHTEANRFVRGPNLVESGPGANAVKLPRLQLRR